MKIKSKKRFKKNDIVLNILVGLTIVGTVYLVIITTFLNLCKAVNIERPRTVEFYLEEDLGPNYSLKRLGKELEDKEIIRSKDIFWIKCQLSGEYFNFKKGNYEFSQDMTIDDVVEIFVNGPLDTEEE